jgi:hypothetical protein
MALENIPEGFINAHKAKKGTLEKDIEFFAEQRLKICLDCNTLNKILKWCSPFKGGCGCFVTKKVYAEDETCPKGKW